MITSVRRTVLTGIGALVFGLSAAKVSQAQTLDCDNAATTPEIVACLDQELRISDDALNAAYRLALAVIDEADWLSVAEREAWKTDLRAAQRLWIQYRDADCQDTVPHEWGGGTGTGAGVLVCLIQKTDVRTEELRARYEAN